MNRILISMSLSTILWVTGCGSKHEEKEEATKFLVTSPLQKDTITTRQYVCQIRSIQHIELRALERGYLQKIYVDEGQNVREGQQMFQIMPMLYQAELQRAQAEVNFADIEYRNTKALADSNVVSANELAMTKAKLDKAKAELTLADTHLQFTQIKAPFSGIMDRFYARQGSLLEEGDLLTILSDNSKMWVYFNVPEAEYLDYKSSENNESFRHVNLMMANHRMFEFPGIVETIEADFNNETGNIAFRATFPNPKALLRHGETGNILLTVPLPGALIIPQKATFEILEKKYVFVVTKDNVVQQREITIGAEMPDIYVVKDGLKADERILLEGLRKVANNDKIEYEYEEPQGVIAHLKVYAE
ncbi:efflux RND transporter periplasmic adaptor subunit [Chryseolinea sp. T2]|uniref:efflux RND transporter periplasmic adaptor subunit n=1 Tax=Chryseolinea sp. T2 TaxID=3129255 RepID=UPI003077DEA9